MATKTGPSCAAWTMQVKLDHSFGPLCGSDLVGLGVGGGERMEMWVSLGFSIARLLLASSCNTRAVGENP